MNIEKGILQLLYYKDCVIIPGFGGFISNYVPARIKEDSQTFIPPAKEIGFKPALLSDDGLLVDYLCKTGAVSVSEAKLSLEEYVDHIYSQLSVDGRYRMKSLGEFSYVRSGQLVFKPSLDVNLLPEAYGMTPFHFSKHIEESEHPLAKSAIFRHGEKVKVVPLPGTQSRSEKQRSLRRIALALPILIAVSLLPLNTRNGLNKGNNTAGVLPLPSLSVVEVPDEEMSAISGNAANGTVSEIVIGVDENEVEHTPFKRDSYAVVAGSFSTEKNAEVLRKEMAEKGYYSETWEASNGFFRVVIKALDDLSSAQKTVEELKTDLEGIEFWILK